MAGEESYPDDLKYHAEHDWARIEGDEAVLGITWWAQDALGELVHFEAPTVGDSTVKERRTPWRRKERILPSIGAPRRRTPTAGRAAPGPSSTIAVTATATVGMTTIAVRPSIPRA